MLATEEEIMIQKAQSNPNAVAAIAKIFYEETGYSCMADEMRAFFDGYDVGREDAEDGDECKIVGKLPAQRAGYAFGFVHEVPPANAYLKWTSFGRPHA